MKCCMCNEFIVDGETFYTIAAHENDQPNKMDVLAFNSLFLYYCESCFEDVAGIEIAKKVCKEGEHT